MSKMASESNGMAHVRAWLAVSEHSMLSGKAWPHKEFWDGILCRREMPWRTGLALEGRMR